MPIYTRHSVRRPWVLFESGAAEAFGLKRFPVRTAGVSISEIELIGKDVTVFDLFDRNSLTDFLVNVCKAHDTKEDLLTIQKQIEHLVTDNCCMDAILRLSKARWIFIAGNLAAEKANDKGYRRRLKKFVNDLTVSLLERGFSIASCPQVEDVGKIVSSAYLDYRRKHRTDETHYRIGGLYPVDRFAREESDLESELQEEWMLHLHEFRKSYLADVECLILVGGNVGTMEEYKAANELKTKVVMVPFFEGTAYHLWKEASEIQQKPYEGWREHEKAKPAKEIAEFLFGSD